MNHKVLGYFSLFFFTSILADRTVTPTITARSQGRDAVRKVVGVTDKIHQYDAGRYFHFSLTPEYTSSFKPGHLAECLFGNDLYGCGTILIQGSEVGGRDSKAWLADYFYLPPDYNASFSIEPRIQNMLVDLDFYVGLDEWMDGLYFRIHSPVTWTQWNLNFCEACDVVTSGSMRAGYFSHAIMTHEQLLGTFGDYAQGKSPLNTSGTSNQAGIGVAFNGLTFGKMERCPHDRLGLAEIRAELGYNFLQKDKYGLGINFQLAAPTGTSRHAEFAFDPVIGNGNHWEVGGGAVGHYILWRSKNEDQHVGLYLDANLTHMIVAKEQRTFDLKGRPNSRYMLAEKLGRPVNYLRTGASTTFNTPIAQFKGIFAPVANLTTLNVNVYSNIQADIAAMINYARKSWEFDLGYNFWIRTCEKISLPARPTDECCNLCTGDRDEWALKGDAFVFGFMSASATPLAQSAPVALSATQCGATIHSGTNAGSQGCPGVDRLQNCGIDNGQFAYGRGTSAAQFLVHTPGLTAASDAVKTSLEPKFINCCDINFQRTRGMSHKLFGHASYTWEKDGWTPYLGAGASVEFGHQSTDDCCEVTPIDCSNPCTSNTTCCTNTCSGDYIDCAVSQWAVWLKGGINFE